MEDSTSPFSKVLHQTNRATIPYSLSKSTRRIKLKVVGGREGRLLAITDICLTNLEILNLILLGQKPQASLRVLSASTEMSGSCAKTGACGEQQGLKLHKTQ